MISKNKVIEIFCIADDFCREYEKEVAKKKQLQQMTSKGYIQRQGKDGSWYVFATSSI